ncbi:MAG: ATP-binding protein [Pseudomonadales bacterium]|nr:ATP-binding protein [Pseudomonadales bacterium]
MFPSSLIQVVEPLKPQDTVIEVSERFAKSQDLKTVLSLPVVRNGKPIGVVSRHILDDLMLTRYGRELNGRKTMLEIMRLDPIIIDIQQPMVDVSQIISSQITRPISEDFIVVKDGVYQGIGFVIDVLITMENDLRERSVQLDIASKAKSQFLANMSHEIRTPMNGLIGMLELLKETALDNIQKSYLGTVEASCDQLMSILNDILNFSKFEAGKLSLECLPIDIPALIQETIDMAYPTANKKSLNISVYIAPDVPNQVLGDPVRLKQMVINLLNNAIKFTDKGYVAIHVLKEHLQTVSGKENLRIEVVDTGIGISEHKIGKLFKRMTQADNTSHRQWGGSGLGLAICKQIVDLYDGEIGVDSELGQGSLFWFTAKFESHPQPQMFCYDFSDLSGQYSIELSREASDYVQRQLEVWRVPIDRAQLNLTQQVNNTVPLHGQTLISDNPDTLNAFQSDTPASHKNAPQRLVYVTDKPHDIKLANTATNIEIIQKPITPQRLANALVNFQDQESHPGKPPSVAVISPGDRNTIEFDKRTGFEHLNVLIAESNEVNQKVVQAYFKKLGANTVLTSNGREAIQCFQQRPEFDLVLMDCEMPVMDGYTAAQMIVQHASKNNLQSPLLIALSAQQPLPKAPHIPQHVFDSFLCKPLRLNQLIKALDQHHLRHRGNKTCSNIC